MSTCCIMADGRIIPPLIHSTVRQGQSYLSPPETEASLDALQSLQGSQAMTGTILSDDLLHELRN